MSAKFEGLPAELLEQSTNNIDTSMPRIAAGLVECVITKAKVEPNKAGDKQNLNIELKTLKPNPTTDGNTVGAGAMLFHTISLTPTPKYTAKRVSEQIAQLCQSARKNVKLGELLAKPEVLVGANVIVKTAIQAETDEYDERTVVKRYEVKA